jgi:hypothetical protein
MRTTILDKVRERILASKEQVFLRRDFNPLGEYRQVSRALSRLQSEYVLIHAGHGVYATPKIARKPDLVVKCLSMKLGDRISRRLKLGGIRVHMSKTITIESAQQRLDCIKLQMAQHVLARNSIKKIRISSLNTLRRWQSQGVWNQSCAEWENILLHGSDGEIRNILSLVCEEPYNRLRQSAPYVDLLEEDFVQGLYRE